jgi:hypothetical protein
MLSEDPGAAEHGLRVGDDRTGSGARDSTLTPKRFDFRRIPTEIVHHLEEV